MDGGSRVIAVELQPWGLLKEPPWAATVAPACAPAAPARPTFEQLYTTYSGFVWRSAKRMGVPAPAVDDVVQEVFLVVHRRLPTFRGPHGMRSWIWRIVFNVVHTYRRTQLRKGRFFGGVSNLDPDELHASAAYSPEVCREHAQAAEVLHTFLNKLGKDKCDAFVLVELEQMTVPEAAGVLDVNENTLHARLRAARRAFELTTQRLSARQLC